MEQWHLSPLEIFAGALGGLVSYLFKEAPTDVRKVNPMRLLTAVLAGAFVAFVVNTHPALSALMGYSAHDVLQTLRKRLLRQIGEEEQEK